MEASELVNVYVHEDDSVQKKLTKRAIKLQKKYYRRRKINERFFAKKSPIKKAISVTFDVVCVLVAVLCGLVCFCNISCRFQNLPSSIGGYMAMQIVSGSMRASGFEIGDNIMIKSVDTDTLKRGDKIAFYVYSPSYKDFRVNKSKEISNSEIGDLEYSVSLTTFFGIQNAEIQEAAKNNSRRVFHEIVGVYEDANGVRWFQTKGTSNTVKDSWYVKETMVIGAYTNTGFASVMSLVVDSMTSSVGIIIALMIPLVIIAMFVVGLCLKDVYVSMLENEIVEEKRKLTDDICVRNKIGFQMAKETKYKVLATASQEEKMKYIGLMWKDGSTPEAIKKYYMRKRMLIQPLEEKNLLNRECERLFEEGENPKAIAKYYEDECARIEAKYQNVKSRIRSIREVNEKARKEKEEMQKKNKRKSKKQKQTANVISSVAETDSAVATVIEQQPKQKRASVSKQTIVPKTKEETGVKVQTKSTVNKKSTARDSSSKGRSAVKKPVSETERLKKSNKNQ